ncbi:MAG: hemopexin repeat-containing protein [Pyrinomonadaceae bacterium]
MKKMMTKTNGSKQKIIIRTVILAFAAISILITLMTIPAALNSQMATLDSLAIPQPTPPHQALEKARADELVQALADATENILDDSMDLDRVNTTKAQIVTGFSRRGSMAGKSGRQVADLFLADAKTVITDADINARLAIEFEDVLKAGDVDGNALQAADVDAAFFHRGEKVSYFFKGSQYYRLTGTNVDAGYPKALPGEWRGLPASFHSGIDAAVQDPYSNNIYFFKGNAYSAFNSVSKTAYPGYDNVTLPGGWQGLPAAFHNGIDAALDEDGSIILYKGGRQLVITNERAVRESDIPASVLAGGSIDAAFKYSNGRNYFFSGSRVARAIGSNVEPGWPNAIKDVWTGVGSDRTQATTGNGSATNSPPTGNQPPLEPKTASCGTGYIAGSDGSCVLEVKFYQRDNMSAAEARDMAARNGWSLATREQVITAWEKAKLHVFAFARTSSGDMCVPIQSNVNNFTRGPNCGDNRGNQGFLYVLSGATAGQPGNSTSNASTNPAPVNNSAAVRQYLDNLRYNEAQLLAEPTGDGEVIPQPRGKLPNKMGSGAVIVCTEVRNSADADYKEISILSPTGSTVYPGALLYANQDLRRGTPRGLKRFKRAPITVTLELAGEKKRMVLTDSENLYAEYQEKLGAEL